MIKHPMVPIHWVGAVVLVKRNPRIQTAAVAILAGNFIIMGCLRHAVLLNTSTKNTNNWLRGAAWGGLEPWGEGDIHTDGIACAVAIVIGMAWAGGVTPPVVFRAKPNIAHQTI